MSTETDRDQLDYWADKYEKALKDGVFDNAPKATSPYASMQSYYAPSNREDQEEGSIDIDGTYWGNLHDAVENSNLYIDPLEAMEIKNKLFQERAEKKDKKINEAKDDMSLGGNGRKEWGKLADKASMSPNPVRLGTTGKDQELSPRSLGKTYSIEDLHSLEELKLQLYDLESKLGSLMGMGDSGRKVETQIANMKKRLDDISDGLGRTTPEEIL